MKQLAVFMNPSHLSWKIISWWSDHIFNVNHLIFTGYGISTLLPFKHSLVGGQGGAGPSSLLHTTLEGPMEGVCGCKMTDVASMWIPTLALDGSCFMVTWTVFLQEPPLGGRPNTKLGDRGTPSAHNR